MKNVNAKTYGYLFLALMAMVALLSSCIVTEKKRREICKTCTLNNKVKDSVSVRIEPRPYPVYIHDTVKTVAPNPCAELCDQNGNIRPGFKKEYNGTKGTKTILSEKDGQLDIETDLNGMKTEAIIQDTIKEHFHSEEKEETARCDKEHRTWLDITCRWVCLILVAGLLVRILVRRYWKQL